MSKTVESFRIALEGEINQWSGFAKALRESDREAFDELMGACRSYTSESINASSPIPFEPLVMSILLGIKREYDNSNTDSRICLGKKAERAAMVKIQTRRKSVEEARDGKRN